MKNYLFMLFLTASVSGFPLLSKASTLAPSRDVSLKLENNRFLMNMFENAEENSKKEETQDQGNQDNLEIENFLSFKHITMIKDHLTKSKISDEDF